MSEPFFSVCMPIYNRGKTITRALKSLQYQTFRDFEVIIVDDRSIDNTVEEIKKYFQSKDYNEHPFEYTFKQTNVHLGGVKNWNEPLKLAKGRYIAVLEGDDQYLPNHLEEAHKILTSYEKIGIYAAGNQNAARPLLGLIDPKTYFRYTYKMENVSPPSETIFIRRYNDKQYFYNDEDYVYAPEVALYLEISSDGWQTYHTDKQTVIRDVSFKEVAFTGVPFKDRFKIVNEYKNHRHIGKKEYTEAINFNVNRAFKIYIGARVQKVGKSDEIFDSIKCVLRDRFQVKHYQLVFFKIIADISIKYKLINILRKIYRLLQKTYIKS